MTRIAQSAISLALIFALGWIPARAEPEKRIAVELILGESYTTALGSAASAKAKQLVEAALAAVLAEKIRYFSFVPSGEDAAHTLSFRIDHPGADMVRSGQVANLNDYYLFLEFRKDQATVDQAMHWVFRDAASNLNGVDSAETIAEKLSSDIRGRYHGDIVRRILNNVSFTSNAQFKHRGVKGWIIGHSRQSLCMPPDSKLEVESIVPIEEFEERYPTEVKRRPSGDDVSTFTRAKVDVGDLLTEPASARVVAVYVLEYEADCDSPLVETSPATVSFSTGAAE